MALRLGQALRAGAIRSRRVAPPFLASRIADTANREARDSTSSHRPLGPRLALGLLGAPAILRWTAPCVLCLTQVWPPPIAHGKGLEQLGAAETLPQCVVDDEALKVEPNEVIIDLAEIAK